MVALPATKDTTLADLLAAREAARTTLALLNAAISFMQSSQPALFEVPAPTVKAAAPRVHSAATVEEGYYFLDGRYVKVQMNRAGTYPYSKVWDAETENWDYENGKGAIRYLNPEHKLTAELAAKFGALYGRCVFCSQTLTDERSIEVGYGPICAENHGLPWGG